MGCFTWLLLLAGIVMLLASIVRWFEQITEAVDQRWWNKVLLLVIFPPGVWLFPSRVSAGRPTSVPRHEPVRGFGKVSLDEPQPNAPPPGTPKEFIGPPKILPKPPSKRGAVDPEKLAKLKAKMREQGMLGDGD